MPEFTSPFFNQFGKSLIAEAMEHAEHRATVNQSKGFAKGVFAAVMFAVLVTVSLAAGFLVAKPEPPAKVGVRGPGTDVRLDDEPKPNYSVQLPPGPAGDAKPGIGEPATGPGKPAK